MRSLKALVAQDRIKSPLLPFQLYDFTNHYPYCVMVVSWMRLRQVKQLDVAYIGRQRINWL